MIVTCEKCDARFRLPDDKVGSGGAKVRCSKCQHTFVVHKDEELELADIDDVMLVDGSASSPAAETSSGAAQGVGVGEWKPGMPAGKPPAPPDDAPKAASSPSSPAAGSGAGQTLIELGGTKKPKDFHELETGLQDISKVTVRDKDDPGDYTDNPAFATAVHEARTRVIKIPKEADFAKARAEAESAKRMTEPNLDSAIVDSDLGLDFDDESTAVYEAVPEVSGGPSSIAEADPSGSAPSSTITDVDPFAAAESGGSLEDELFSDLPEQEETGAEPFDPFETAPGADVGNRKATRQMGDIASGIDIGTKRDEPRSSLGTVVNGLAASVGVGVLAVGLTFFFAGDTLLALARRNGPVVRLPTFEGVRLLSTRSVRYPTSAGEQVIVVSGEAQNASDKDRDDLYVVAEIRDAGGKVIGNNRAPLGLTLTPPELTELRGDESVTEAFAARAAATTKHGIAAGGTAPYTVVILRPPSSSVGLVPLLKLVKGEPVVVPKPAAPVEEEAAVVEEEPRRKGKGKGKRRKGKRRKGKKRKKKKAEEE